jgi:hypothetical protein
MDGRMVELADRPSLGGHSDSEGTGTANVFLSLPAFEPAEHRVLDRRRMAISKNLCVNDKDVGIKRTRDTLQSSVCSSSSTLGNRTTNRYPIAARSDMLKEYSHLRIHNVGSDQRLRWKTASTS